MQRYKFTLLFLFSFIFLNVTNAASFQCPTSNQAIQVGEQIAESYAVVSPQERQGLITERRFTWPNASYIALHFSEFDLADGDYVEISDQTGIHKQRYTGQGKELGNQQAISNFWAAHIPGETAILRFYRQSDSFSKGVAIDRWAYGYPSQQTEDIEAVCGMDDKEWTPCYTEDPMYQQARAVTRLLINGTFACTGWLLGSEGHLMTNHHCIADQDDANNTDYEFMAEGLTCDTDCSGWFACPGIIEATSGELIATNETLDYTLVKLPENLTTTYGHLQLRPTLPDIGERIYIPQHPGAFGKQLAVFDDQSQDFCSLLSTDELPCTGGRKNRDIGYLCDTAGGSSGSPVLAHSDHLVVALHHCANCPNRGVPIPNIIADLGRLLPANALGGNIDCDVNKDGFYDRQDFVLLWFDCLQSEKANCLRTILAQCGRP